MFTRAQTANQAFVADRRSNGSVLDREKVLNDLGAKFEVYVELRKNLDEGKIVSEPLRDGCGLITHTVLYQLHGHPKQVPHQVHRFYLGARL